MKTYWRLHPEDESPEELLEPENQVSKPWGGADHGHCDKCDGSGRIAFQTGNEDACPTCRGTGEITESQRRGVSVFADPDGLYRYMLRRDSDMEGSVLVELEGKLSDDPDFDADEGALLVFPTRIVGVGKLDRDRIDELEQERATETA